MAKIKLGDRVELLKDDYDMKKGHQGIVVGTFGNTFLVLYSDYHNGHNGGGIGGVKRLKNYSINRLYKMNGGCHWQLEDELKFIKTFILKSWKGKVK
jgi:hypothetical protein